MSGFKLILVLAFIVLAIILGPALFIWGVNELLEQMKVAYQIPWNFWTWLAALFVMPKSAGYKS
jgi:hypothetical protein